MRRSEIFAKELPTQRHSDTEKNDKRLETNHISCDLLTLSLGLCASVFDFHSSRSAHALPADGQEEDFTSGWANLRGYRYGTTERIN